MRGKLLLCLTLVVILSSFALASTIKVNITNTDNTSWAELFRNDNVNLTVGLYSENVLQNVDNCSISYDNVSFYQANESSGNLYNFTVSNLSDDNLYFNCSNGTDYYLNWPVPYNIQDNFQVNSDYYSMQDIDNRYYIVSNYTKPDRSVVHYDLCNVSVEGNDYLNVRDYRYTYSGSGNVDLFYNCSYTGGWYNGSAYIEVKPYEPQFSNSSNNPFSELSSSAGYKLGNYDIDLDGNDDIIILEDNGLIVYDGNDVRANYSGSSVTLNSKVSFNSIVMGDASEFFVTDFNFDGIGDILIGDDSDVYLLTGKLDGNSFGFNAPQELISNMNNILSFGAFNINDDLYKDIMVSNWTLSASSTIQYTYFDGRNFTVVGTYVTNKTNFICEDSIIADMNKDNIQDIVCYQKNLRKALQVYIRPSGDMNISNWDVYNISLGDLVATDIFATDIDSNGDLEIGIFIDNYGDSYTIFYDYNTSGIFYMFNTSYTQGLANSHGFVDTMNSDSNYYYFSYFDGSDSYVRTITNTDIPFFDFDKNEDSVTFLNYDFDGDKDSDLFTIKWPLWSGTTFNTNIYENNISSFRNLSRNYSASINISSGSDMINFSFTNIATEDNWKYNDYFYKVKMPGKTYRNDCFDTERHTKYYLTDSSNKYLFSGDSEASYSIDFTLNTYSMILNDYTVQNDNKCPEYDLLFNDTNVEVTHYCDYSGSLEKKFPANIVFQNVSIDINNAIFNSSIVINVSDGVIKNSIFNASTITIIGDNSKQIVFDNVSFINGASLNANASNIKYIECNLDSLTVNSFDGVVFDYGSNTSGTDYSNRYVYNLSTISFLNSTGSPILLSGSYSDSLNNSIINLDNNITDWFMTWNGTAVVLNFSFNTHYEYFNESVFLIVDPETENITFVETHIPEWDYAKNNSHMTDFRNYTLLQNIDNVNNLKVSLVDDNLELNLSFNEPVNLSDTNLTDLVSVGESGYNEYWFNNSIANNFNYSFKTGLTNNYNGSFNDSWWLVNVGNDYNGVISNTSYDIGKYTFLQDGCDSNGCVLGKYTVEENGMVDFHYKIISRNSFNSYANVSGMGGMIMINKNVKQDLFNYGDLYYHEGDFLNDGSSIIIVN